MSAEHESLAEKAALFRQMEWCAADDELDASEMQNRQTYRRFFHPTHPPFSTTTASSASDDSLQLRASDKTKPVQGAHRRVLSAPISGEISAAHVIKATPATKLARNSRVGALLEGRRTTSPDTDEAVIPDSSRRQNTKVQLERSKSTPLPAGGKRLFGSISPTRPAAVGSKKRKRGSSPAKRTEEEQIFQGLSFFYVPDNDIAPARRIRIAKAKEYGATWTRMISGATHIVVDKSLQYKDLNSILARTEKSRPPKVVNEDYPIDCIQFKAKLDCTQKKYLVAGQPVADKTVDSTEVPQSSEESCRSLQLKAPQNNPKRWDYVPPVGTPERSEESSQASRIKSTPAPTDSQPIILDLEPAASLIDRVIPAVIEKTPIEKHPSRGEVAHIATSRNVGKEVGDELSEYIAMMQEFKDLPLDSVEVDDSRPAIYAEDSTSMDDHSGSEEDKVRKTRSKKATIRSGRKDIRFEERFACNQASAKETAKENPNARTIEVLQNMTNYYDRIDDTWRTVAYRKAISTLKRQHVKITTEEEAFRLPMIGERLAQKIEEIVTTNRLRRLEYAEAEPTTEALQLFMGIYGVGSKQAHQWIAQGLRTLGDLRKQAKLSTNQIIGIEHYDDLNSRIPRKEVAALGVIVQKAAARIDPKTELIIGGSYRRGASTSGDIDFIVTKPNTESSRDLVPFLERLIRRLEKEKFLVARLASSRPGHDGSKWHGCCVLPKISGFNDNNYQPTWRRIDFLLVPESEMGAALIYFTGNDIFNRSMRLLASRKGMRLNQRGLYKDVLRGPGRAKITEGELVEGRDEKKIFDYLGVQWREPHERWC